MSMKKEEEEEEEKGERGYLYPTVPRGFNPQHSPHHEDSFA